MKKIIKKTRTSFLLIGMLCMVLIVSGCLRAPIEQGAIVNPVSADTELETLLPPESEDTTESEKESPENTDEESSDEETLESTVSTEETSDPRPSDPLESTMIIQLEGMDEEIPVLLYISDLGYSMYYDHQRYNVIQTTGRLDGSIRVDEYMPSTPADALPDIYLQIGHYPELSVEQALEEITKLLNLQYTNVELGGNTDIGTDDLNGSLIYASNGNKWDSETARITIVSDGKNGSYFFHSGYFTEAAEGHGARFEQLMQSFRID